MIIDWEKMLSYHTFFAKIFQELFAVYQIANSYWFEEIQVKMSKQKKRKKSSETKY